MGFNSEFKGLNVAVPALKMIHVKDVQKVQQHQKSLNKCTIRVMLFVNSQVMVLILQKTE